MQETNVRDLAPTTSGKHREWIRPSMWLAWLLVAVMIASCGAHGERDLGKEEVEPLDDLFQSSPSLFAVAGDSYEYRAQASRGLADTLTYTLVDVPAGMAIESDTGVLSWVPGLDQGGTHLIHVVATNGEVLLEQEYYLEVAVPALLAEATITSAGGVLESSDPDLRVIFPAGAVARDTRFSLWVLNEGQPPLWAGMHRHSKPFMIRTDLELAEVSVSVEFAPNEELRDRAEMYLAHGTPNAHFAVDAASANSLVTVVNPTRSGPTPGQVVADFEHVVEHGWFQYVDLIATVYGGDEFEFVWVDPGEAGSTRGSTYEELDPELEVQALRAALRDHKANVPELMGCKVPNEKVRVYIADMKAGDILAFMNSAGLFFMKSTLSENSADMVRHVAAHEYFHIVQAHMVPLKRQFSDRLRWFWEATAEFAATQLISEYIFHAPVDGLVGLYGLADVAGDDTNRYRLFSYFRFLNETRDFRVCDLLRDHKKVLITSGPLDAIAAALGDWDVLAQSYLDFSEALFFFSNEVNFGKDSPSVQHQLDISMDYAGGTQAAVEPTAFRGGYGIKVNRTSSEAQTLLLSLGGEFVSDRKLGSSNPLIRVTDITGAILADTEDLVFTNSPDSATLVLPHLSEPSFYITVTQGRMRSHKNSSYAVDLTLSEMGVVATPSGTEISEYDAVTIDVTLAANPGDTVVSVDVASLGLPQGKINPARLVFDKDKPWDQPQTVTVTGVEGGEDSYQVEFRISDPVAWQPEASGPYTVVELANTASSCPVGIYPFDMSGNYPGRAIPAADTTLVMSCPHQQDVVLRQVMTMDNSSTLNMTAASHVPGETFPVVMNFARTQDFNTSRNVVPGGENYGRVNTNNTRASDIDVIASYPAPGGGRLPLTVYEKRVNETQTATESTNTMTYDYLAREQLSESLEYKVVAGVCQITHTYSVDQTTGVGETNSVELDDLRSFLYVPYTRHRTITRYRDTYAADGTQIAQESAVVREEIAANAQIAISAPTVHWLGRCEAQEWFEPAGYRTVTSY